MGIKKVHLISIDTIMDQFRGMVCVMCCCTLLSLFISFMQLTKYLVTVHFIYSHHFF